MQIGGEVIENLFVTMVLKFFFLKRHRYFNNSFPCLFAYKWAKYILVWNCPSDELWNQKLL
jgi:hypothetical protein